MTARTLLAGIVSALMLVTMPGTQARADPTVAQIEAQIRVLWDKAEPLIEQYNHVHDNYLKNKAKQTALEKKLGPLRLQVDLAQVRVGAIAAQIYKGQGPATFNAVLSAGSPRVLADQLAYLDFIARQQERQIAGVAAMKNKYDAQKAPLEKLLAQLAQQDADLAAKKKTIDTELAELQKLRLKAYGSTGGSGSFRPWPCPAEYQPTKGYKAAVFACKQAGHPYDMGAAGPYAYDCSGLTMAAWNQVGVYLPHEALEQAASVRSVTRRDLKVGDLVFYYTHIHHVAIYVGGGKVMHAPTSGDYVRMAVLEDVGPVHSYGHPS